MKVARFALMIVIVAAGLVSCGSLPTPESLVSGAIAGTMSGGASAAARAVADFQSGEVLASQDSGKIEDASFYVSKVLQPASAATKNQAEVIYVSDGKKYWVNFIVNSRKADKADFKVGATVLVLPGWDGHDEIPADPYRKDRWVLGNVTSVEELFKNRVEVNGESFNVAYVRIPTDLKK